LKLPEREFDAYIFDCDGTLADTMPLHYRAWQRMLAERGAAISETLFHSMAGRPTEMIIEVLRDDHGVRFDDVDGAARRKEDYFLELIGEVTAIDAVLEVARRWRGIKPLAVASGGCRTNVERTLEALGIHDWFDAVVCVEDYLRPKPWPDPFLEAARRLRVRPSGCLVFEDSPLGVEAATAAGMDCVFVER